MSMPSLPGLRRLALVLVGGFCGTLARYYLAAPLLALAALVLPGGHSGFPFDIFAINLSGAFALGLLYGLAEHGVRVSPDTRLALGTGFLGAYTTFSTFTVGGDTLLLGGAWLTGTLYLAGSVALGVFCAHLGHVVAGAVVAHRRLTRRMRVRARRAWRTAFAPRYASGIHASGVQPWRLSHRVSPHANHAHHAGHNDYVAHAHAHAASRLGDAALGSAGDAGHAGRDDDDRTGSASRPEEEVR